MAAASRTVWILSRQCELSSGSKHPSRPATNRRSLPTPVQARLVMVFCSRDDTSIPRWSGHPPCDGGTHVPMHRRDHRPAEPIRVLATSRPWRPTTKQRLQHQLGGAVHHSARNRESLAESWFNSPLPSIACCLSMIFHRFLDNQCDAVGPLVLGAVRLPLTVARLQSSASVSAGI